MKKNTLKCFVGHVFNKAQIDDLRLAIEESFRRFSAFSISYADDKVRFQHIFAKIAHEIEHAALCIFELSDASKPNVFLELGYALGQGKECVMLVKRGSSIPSDLAGIGRIEYESMQDLKRQLDKYLHPIISYRNSKNFQGIK